MKFRRSISPRVESPAFDEKRFWMGLVIGIIWSVAMYLFLQMIRSSYYFMFGYSSHVITLIDIPEFNFYSFILAFFSIYFGAYQFLEFTLNKNRRFRKSNFRKRNILFNQRNLVWNSIIFGFKFLIITVFAMSLGVTSIWEFYSMSWWASIAFILFTHFYFWQNLKFIFKTATKWSVLSLPIILFFAFSLSQKKMIQPDFLNKIRLGNVFHYTKNIEIPESTYTEKTSKKSLATPIYVWHTKGNPDDVHYNNSHQEIGLGMVNLNLENFSYSKPEHIRTMIIANLAIDKDVKIKYLYPLFDEIRKNYVRNITLATVKSEEAYPKRKYYRQFDYAIKIYPSYYFENLNHITKHLQNNPNSPTNTWNKPLKEIDYIDSPNDLKLYFSFTDEIKILPNGQYLINDRIVDINNLGDTIQKIIKNRNHKIYFNPSPDATYEYYFFAWHELKRIQYELRNKLALKKFSKQYHYIDDIQQKEINTESYITVGSAYNADERFLYDFFKKK